MLAGPFLTKNISSFCIFRKTLFWLSLHVMWRIFLSVIVTILNFMKGTYSFPIWDFIRFVRWSPSLSSLWKESASNPRGWPPSFTPTRRSPPFVFRNAVMVLRTPYSILLSNSFVWRFVLKLDLNSVVSDSPLFIISITCLIGS